MQYRVNDDLKLVAVKGKGGARAKKDKDLSKEELMKLLLKVKSELLKASKAGGSGPRGGFLGMLLGPVIKMISNGVQGKKWNDGIGLLGGLANDRTPMHLQGSGVAKVGGKKTTKASVKAKPKRKLPDALVRRNKLVKAVMKQTGLKMKEALQYMKQNNIK